MNPHQRQSLIELAQRQRAAGDDQLARALLRAATRQFAATVRHHADEALTSLHATRTALLAAPSH